MTDKKSANRKAAKALIGTTIQRRYHVVRLLGDGGMGAVYKAADTVLRRFVAIKLLHPATADNAAAVERFVREARSSAAIGHPNIIDVLDFGYEGKRPYLVMEYLRGRSLSEAIAEERRLSVARACNIATHSLAGLAAAHDRGILHRDLKPANMMLIALLGDRDFVKLCDFGFAALVQPSGRIDEGRHLTPARTLVGTPAYAAPERLRGDTRRDPRLDVWSIGVVLFEMLAGRRPFDAPTFRELARKVRKEPAPTLRGLRADIPRGLDVVVQKALAKKREHRFASAAEFAAALVPFGGRVVPDFTDAGSDSFTMDLLRLRARETQQRVAIDARTGEPLEPAELERLRQSSPKAARKSKGSRRKGQRSPPGTSAPHERKQRRTEPDGARPIDSVGLPRRGAAALHDVPGMDMPEQTEVEATPPRRRRRAFGVPREREEAREWQPTQRPSNALGRERRSKRPDHDQHAYDARHRTPHFPHDRAHIAERTGLGSASTASSSARALSAEPSTPQSIPATHATPSSARHSAESPRHQGERETRQSARMPDRGRAKPLADHFPTHGGQSTHTVLGTAFDTQLGRGKRVRGALPLAVLRFVSRRFGERALKELLGSVPDPAAEVFASGIDNDTWIGYEDLNALIGHIDARLGRDDLHLVVQCGRAAAESGFEQMRAIHPPAPPPQELMRAMPSILSHFYQGLEGRVIHQGRGYARLQIDEVGESSLVGAVFLVGFFDRSLDRFGAKEVEVSLTSTPALGDADCIYDITWLA